MPDALTPAQVDAFLAEAFPSAHADGTRCHALGHRQATARWIYDPSELRPGGYISGPRMFGLADCALWFATFTETGLQAMSLTSELSIRFLRPAIGGDLFARATLESVGKRRLVGSVQLWVAGAPDDLVAVAQGAYVRPSR
jgi:uncharacterized protein (TIGR00369 family)